MRTEQELGRKKTFPKCCHLTSGELYALIDFQNIEGWKALFLGVHVNFDTVTEFG